VAPGRLDEASGEIRENDLVTALRTISSDQRGWKAEKISVKCQSCQAISVFDPARVAQRCDFCGSAQLVPYEQIKAPISPESLLAFKVSESDVRETIRQWYKSRWFSPNKLGTSAITDTVRGIYLPYWTFDAQAHAEWTAESGYHYYTTETYKDANGNSQTRQVQHTRWEFSSGAVDHFFDDELVPASLGVKEELLRKIEPFPTKDLMPYKAGYVAGWVVEQYQIDLVSAAPSVHASRWTLKVQSMCAAQVPGDTYKNLKRRGRLHRANFQARSLPVWLLTFNYGSEAYQVLINGYTGAIAGKYPLSVVKIVFAGDCDSSWRAGHLCVHPLRKNCHHP
jgi:hypothetical protein